MAGSKNLQISSRAPDGARSPDHKRFDNLVRQIAQSRESLADWQENITAFHQAYIKVLQPLRDSFAAMCRKCVFAIDALLDQPTWSRPERAALREILCDNAGQLLSANDADTELKALFDKHSDVDFDTGRQQDLEDLKEMAEHVTGIDLGDLGGIRSDDDLAERMFERMASQRAAADDARKTQRKSKSASQKKRESEAQLATQSVREIYRKLASAVHPDRESDPEERARRTSLMQRINQAYAANDLLTLLEIQLQAEQVDAEAIASRIGSLGEQRLKQYNKVLSGQLAGLRQELAAVEANFRAEYGIDELRSLGPRKLRGLIQEQADLLRAGVAQQQRDLRMLGDRAGAKRWLKQQQRALRQARYDAFEDAEDDYF